MAEQKEFLSIKPLDIDKFIKVNELKQITNPIFFVSNNSPTPDGLLSNEIFGITMQDRANTFAYINLGGPHFIHPLFYSIWQKIDRKLPQCVHCTAYFKLTKEGYLEPSSEEDGGETGLKFLYKNRNNIHFRPGSNSIDRKNNIKFLERFREFMFIQNYPVIPAYYRDVSTQDRHVGVGDINMLYASLLRTANSLKEYDEYGLTLYDSVIGRIQDILLNIYEYFTKGNINGVSTGSGMAGKFGVIRSAVQSKTADYSSRLVITAPNLKVENRDDMLTDLDHVSVPLASVVTNFYPYILTYIRNFFYNEYTSQPVRDYIIRDKNGKPIKTVKVKLKDFRISFSDDILREELDRFVHGIADRFRPIRMPTEDRKYPDVGIWFRGNLIPPEKIRDETGFITPDEKMPILERPMTWCDLLYLAAMEVTQDKMVLITRYPIDSCYNQFPSGINVSSTIKTEPMLVNGKLYKHYPYIRKELIGTNTTDKFVDTLNMSNTLLSSCGADYDGDQVTVKSVYSIEANAELREQLNSKRHYISLAGMNIAQTTNEGVMALYSLTMNGTELGQIKFNDPEF